MRKPVPASVAPQPGHPRALGDADAAVDLHGVVADLEAGHAAVALGHRWNAMPPTQLHEFLEVERRYVRTAMI